MRRGESVDDVVVFCLELLFWGLRGILEVVVEVYMKAIFTLDYVHIVYHFPEIIKVTLFTYPNLHRVSLVIEIVQVGVLGELFELLVQFPHQEYGTYAVERMPQYLEHAVL